MESDHRRFPFSSVVGLDDAKLALLLIAVDPLIGGVLLRGEKGSAKTTLARGLAGLLGDDAPFVDLPLGATEDRLIGTLDLTRALIDNETAFTPGLLARVDGGVLYVDEVNLLADHLVDTLLDVSVSGINRVERDAVSHEHSARFVLIGSMNPEEGELRPQLLDRFGLSVEITASRDPAERSEAVRRRLRFDQSTGTGSAENDDVATAQDAALAAQIAAATPAEVPNELIETASRLALAVGAEGLRADLVLCRAAAAHAGLDGRTTATADDLRRVAPLVLAHRGRRNPFDPPTLPPDELDQAMDDTFDDPPPPPEPAGSDLESDDPSEDPDQSDEASSSADDAVQPMAVGEDRSPPPATMAPRASSVPSARASGSGVRTESGRGRLIRDVAPDARVDRPVAAVATVRHLADRRKTDPDASFATDDVRHAVREQTSGRLLILVVDTSGSMGAQARAEAATGTALGLLTDAYQRRDHVAVITFAGDSSQVVLQPTGSVEVARHRLTNLETGGTTPLAAGLHAALGLASKRRDQEREAFLVLLSDGRASGDPSALEDALDAATAVGRAGLASLVLDCETGTPRLDLAAKIADALGAPCVSAVDLDSASMTRIIQTSTEESRRAR